MSGGKYNKNTLNKTLMFIIKLLKDNNIKNWFVGYGTLLGIIRENSCIDGDDDIDIIIDANNYDILKNVLIKNNINIRINNTDATDSLQNEPVKLLQTIGTSLYCKVEFYMANVDNKGNFYDRWEEVTWSECYNEKNELLEYILDGELLYLPFSYEQKLINRYGANWMIPARSKGVNPIRPVL